MAKDKKKTLGIKTTRYFTKTCINCKFEYPNWFTNCPKCGAAWDESHKEDKGSLSSVKKTIKIVVKITEEDFDYALDNVQLIFSADQGKSWYQMIMENKMDYFIAELVDVPTGSIIVYYMTVFLKSGESIVENNDGKYYYYTVGSTLEQSSNQKSSNEDPTLVKTEPTLATNEIGFDHTKKEYYKPQTTTKSIPKQEYKLKPPEIQSKLPKVNLPQSPKQYHAEDNITIFGRPQTEVDPDLKNCSNCNSKIKKMWSTCPICGKPT